MDDDGFVNIESLIVNGSNHFEVVETSIGKFKIRPLEIGERAIVESGAYSGISTKTKAIIPQTRAEAYLSKPPKEADIDLNIKDLHVAEWDTKFMAVAFGLSVKPKKYKPEQIRKMNIPKSDFFTLYNAIMKITEVDASDVSKFSEESNGSVPDDVGDDGIQVSTKD